MADLPYLATRLYNRPLLVTPLYAQTVSTVLASRMGVAPTLSAEEMKPAPPREPFSPSLADGVLTVPIVGGLYHRGDSIDAMSGAMSYTHLQNLVAASIDDEDVRGILLDIDSPGGEAAGCFEFCQMLAKFGERKPIWAIANAQAASAAYAVACAASRIIATPSAEVGSIGVYVMHTDMSVAMERRGVAITFIHAGAHKVDGNPFEPLPEDARAWIQNGVDDAYAKFVGWVASRRTDMSSDDVRATEARVFLPEDALKLGMIDEVTSYEEARAALVAKVSERKTNLRYIEGVPVTWQT